MAFLDDLKEGRSHANHACRRLPSEAAAEQALEPRQQLLAHPLRDRVQPCAGFPGQHDAFHYWFILVLTLIQILALILFLSVIQLLTPIRFLPLSQLGSPTPPSVRLSALFPHRFLILTPSVRILPLFQHKLAVFVLPVLDSGAFEHGLVYFVSLVLDSTPLEHRLAFPPASGARFGPF